MAELAGVMVGNYFLLECLGREGMVETYRARPTTRGGYDVVLRIFRPAFPDPTNFQEHFAAEVEKVWRCHHEHIQPLIEYGAGDDLLYSVTQATDAVTLEQFLERRESEPVSMPLPVVARIISQVGVALHYAHEQHIAHGNIQPASVLVENESSLLLTNFSMKHIRQESDAVVAQVQEGNAAYIAPEQVVGILSPACDIYAMGVLLFRLLTGRLPYDGESAGEIALKHANQPVPSVREWRPDISEAVELVARVALAKSPSARFPTVVAFVDALLAAIKDDAPPVVVATPPVRRIPVRARRTAMTWSRVFTLISVLVMLSALAGIVFYFAATPFHLENLPFLPLQNLGQSGGFHINPGDGTTPTTGPTPVGSTTPQHSGKRSGNAPTSSGQTTPVAGVTPTPGTSPPAITNPGSTATPMPVVCVTGTLSIDGSPYLQQAIQQIDSDYNVQCAGLQIGLRADGSRALNLVQHGHIDIADADVTAQTIRNLTDHPIAALLYSLIASPNITLSGLSTAQIQAIYQGQITNWSQLGGPNQAITLILPPAASAISSIFHAFVLHGSPVSANAFIMKKDQPARVAQLVSQIPGALGFVPLTVASGASTPVQMLAIDGAFANSQSLIAGTYIFWSVEHLYTSGDGTPQAQAYIQFATSPQEMNLFSRFGAVPVGMIDPAILQSHVPGPLF
ncbi:MAG TPA: serine/threonine-protein kinase [Ktedonobacteraceae bacterium]|nr:serine/threonine-protein kinase [Ktedonobacteraceae bacterium]